MFVYLLVLLNVIMLFFTFSSFSDKKKIFVPIAEAISVFLCIFAVCSGIMWIFDAFSVEFCLMAVTFLIVLLFAFVYYKSPVKGKEFFALGKIAIDHRVIFNKCAILVATFLSLGAFSTIGIGFNDGNAQIQALSIINGHNQVRFTIDEYDAITPDSKYEYFFFDSINNIDPENFTANYWISDAGSEDGSAKMWAEFGSNPVYPSILALSAGLFGIKRMAFIQAVFAFCLFVFVDEILRELKCDWKLRSVLILLLGFSPIVVYCNHTTLVEPLLAFCMVLFMYFLLCKKNLMQILSALGIITFGFLHTSVYTMLPLFLVVYWISYIHTREKRHLIASVIAIAGYVISFVYLNIVAFENTLINYALGIPFFKDKGFVFVIIISVLTLVVDALLLIIFGDINAEKMTEFERGKGKIVFKIIMAVASVGSIVMMIIVNIFKCNTYKDALNITFVSFIVCSGIILIPYIVARLVSTSYNLGYKEAVTVVMFVYTVLLYSAVMKPMLGGYYYEARYLSSFIPFVIIIGGMMLRFFKEDEKYFLPIIATILIAIPYTTSLLSSDAERRLDINVFEDVLKTVEDHSDEDTIIFVEKSLMKYYYYPLLHSSKAKVYPIEPSYFDDFCLDTMDTTSRVIYISDSTGDRYRGRGGMKFISEDKQNLVSENDESVILGLPNAFHEGPMTTTQVIEVLNLRNLLDYNSFKKLNWWEFNIVIKDVEIDENGLATVKVAVSDQDRIYTTGDYGISYHVDYEKAKDVYDFPRIPLGPYVLEDYVFEIDLSEEDEAMKVTFDIVEEEVRWFSFNHRVPSVLFEQDEEGEWIYTIEQVPEG